MSTRIVPAYAGVFFGCLIMRSVDQLRAIHDANIAWLNANYAEDDPLRDAEISCEPRFWMDWEEWCEFVESNEDFCTMARREALRQRGIT